MVSPININLYYANNQNGGRTSAEIINNLMNIETEYIYSKNKNYQFNIKNETDGNTKKIVNLKYIGIGTYTIVIKIKYIRGPKTFEGKYSDKFHIM